MKTRLKMTTLRKRKLENEMDSPQSPDSGTDMAPYQRSDETHNTLSDRQNQSREVSEKNKFAESNDAVRQDVMSEETVGASYAISGDDSPSQSFQNENIEQSNVDNEEIQRSASPTNNSPNTSFTKTFKQRQLSGAFGDDADDASLQNGEMTLNENEAENQIDSLQSPESRTDMAQYEGSNEIHRYNSVSDIQSKTSQEQEIEKLQRELNIKNENLVTLQEDINRQDEIINEIKSKNRELLHRCLASETSAEAADNLREQCEDKNHQIETLEAKNRELLHRCLASETSAGDLAFARDEIESLKRHLEETGDIKKAIEDKENLEAKLHSRNENNSALLSKHLKMEKKGEEMAAELKKMQQKYQDEARRSEELSGQLTLKNEEVTTTENKHKQEIDELRAKYKTERDLAEKENELLKNHVTNLTKSAQHLQAENKQIKDNLQTKSTDCENLKSERLRITTNITALNDEIRQLKAVIEVKEAEKTFANEFMQKAVREQQKMMHCMGNLQRIEQENHQLKNQNRFLLEQNTKLQASLQEYGLLRDHIQEYYKAMQDAKMELEREKEKSRHINEQLSRTGYRLDSMVSELHNYRTLADGYRRSLEEGKEKFSKLERELDRLTIVNEKLTEERDKSEQRSFEYRDECRSLREDLEKSQTEYRELLSQTHEVASDGTTSLLQGNHFTSTLMGNEIRNPIPHFNFTFGQK